MIKIPIVQKCLWKPGARSSAGVNQYGSNEAQEAMSVCTSWGSGPLTLHFLILVSITFQS